MRDQDANARLVAALRRFLGVVRAELRYLDAHRIRRHFCYFPCNKATFLKHTHTDAAMRAKEWRS